jgi:mannosyltransferase OCH1-like enzyme
MNSTGPYFLTTMTNKYKFKNIPRNYILSKNEFSGDCNICNENICTGGTYFSHITGNSWHSFDSSIYNFILCQYKKILLVMILILLCIFYYKN